ncbi:type I secretion system permease/ATPase [Stella sp.]|uniref:type I secretion system permease/ATPase n=1 Tax=Stella sp. TaxID=2912054 RepID=UPI0035ADD2CB
MAARRDATAADGYPLGLVGTLSRCAPALVISFAISLFLTLAMLVVPIYMMQVYDRVLSSRSLPTLFWLTVVVIGALAAAAVLQLARSLVHQRLGEWLGERLGEVAIPATVARALRDGGGSTQTLRDANEVRGFFAGRSLPTAMEMLWTPLFFVVLFLMHPAYGVIGIGGAALLTVLGIVNEVVSHRSLVSSSDASVKAHQHIGSALRNAEIVEAMGLIDRILVRWRQANGEAAILARRGHLRSEAIAALSRMLRLSLQVLLIATGAALIIDRAVGPGTLFAAMIILGRALGPYESLIEGWRQWLSAWAALRRLREIEVEQRAVRSAIGLARPEGPLEIDRLVYVPPGASRPTLRGVSLTVEPGEVLAIMGPSGAGKSTLARLITGVWKPTSGAVRLDGQDVHHWDRAAFGRVSGYLPQQVGLFDGTIAENIARLEDAPAEAIVAAARRADVHGLIGRLPHGYDTEITDPGFLLTGGQRQRIGLARALFGEPRLLVLDEPDANLDQAGTDALLAAVRWARSAGAIVIVISHRNTLLSVADRILELRDGVAVRVADAVTEPLPGIARHGPVALAGAAR